MKVRYVGAHLVTEIDDLEHDYFKSDIHQGDLVDVPDNVGAELVKQIGNWEDDPKPVAPKGNPTGKAS